MRAPEFQANATTSTGCDVCLDPQKSFAKLFKRTVILLAGPTGSGKTDVSLKLAPMIDGKLYLLIPCKSIGVWISAQRKCLGRIDSAFLII